MSESVKLVKDFKFPGLSKTVLDGLAEKGELDVTIKGSGGEFTLSGDQSHVDILVGEAIRHSGFQAAPR